MYDYLHDENLFEMNMALRCEVKNLKRIVEEYQSGKRYLKIQEDHNRVTNGYIREIKRLRKEIEEAHRQSFEVREKWTNECYDVWQEWQDEKSKYEEKILNLKDKVWEVQRKNDEEKTALILRYEDRLYEKDCVIEKLKNELAHANALLGNDGTNSGLPTSQTPIGKKKRVPNSRTKTGRKKGGQPDHEKHELEAPDESEITDVFRHDPVTEEYVCPSCDGEKCVPTDKKEVKYEYDVCITVKKIKHEYYCYRCLDCGTLFRSQYAPNLRGNVQYGSSLQALTLSLTNTVHAAMGKTSSFLAGITNEILTPCEGYVAKLQKRAARFLRPFREELRRTLISKDILYWDDTVISILGKRGCLRFYGDEGIAYYTAHAHKDMEGIDKDNVLTVLTPRTTLMHDHNSINYNPKFKFRNIECNQHLERDCQKNCDNTGHSWSANLKKLISKAIADRNREVQKGKKSFNHNYIRLFHEQVDKFIATGWNENEALKKNYGASDERSLLRRISKYRDNYFRWLEDFSLPTTNNLSERSLRDVKSHMKISGQFESVEAADDHALIKTYIETCRRNNINEIIALQRLCDGKPYTVQEILSQASK